MMASDRNKGEIKPQYKRALFIGTAIMMLLTTLSGALAVRDDRDIGYDYFNNTLHVWNIYDDYYFNASSGMQFTNHYDEYWSKNVFCGGYYNGDTWNKLACVDELPFTWSIDTDNSTYINITGYKDVSYMGYTVRFALRYSLGVYDRELKVIPYVKNIGDENIPVNLGFAWHIKNIKIANTYPYDLFGIGNLDTNTSEEYLLNQTLNKTYKNVYESGLIIRDNVTNDFLQLRWNTNLTYLLRVESKPSQYNSPVTLGLKVGTLGVGQEKLTTMYWKDPPENCPGGAVVCWVDAPDSYTNYSNDGVDDVNPSFISTMDAGIPVGCSLLWCRLGKRTTGAWGGYTYEYSNCIDKNWGTKDLTHDTLTDWRAELAYQGTCPEALSIYYTDEILDLLSNDHIPNATNVVFNDSSIYTTEDFKVNFTFQDDDADSLAGNETKWYIDGVYTSAFDNYITIYSENTSVGEVWSVQVRVKDDATYEKWSEWSWVLENETILSSSSVVTTTLISPINNYATDDGQAELNCSATDSLDGLVNISLWHNLSGVWHLNKTVNVGGGSNWSLFNLTNHEGKTGIWNCIACSSTSCDWGDNNRTITITHDQHLQSLTANNTGNISTNSIIEFNATWAWSDDSWLTKLIICNNSNFTGCDYYNTTNIVCNSSGTLDNNATCSYTVQASDNITWYGGTCDAYGFCDFSASGESTYTPDINNHKYYVLRYSHATIGLDKHPDEVSPIITIRELNSSEYSNVSVDDAVWTTTTVGAKTDDYLHAANRIYWNTTYPLSEISSLNFEMQVNGIDGVNGDIQLMKFYAYNLVDNNYTYLGDDSTSIFNNIHQSTLSSDLSEYINATTKIVEFLAWDYEGVYFNPNAYYNSSILTDYAKITVNYNFQPTGNFYNTETAGEEEYYGIGLLAVGVGFGFITLLFFLTKNLDEEHYISKTFFMVASPFVLLIIIAVMQQLSLFYGASDGIISMLNTAFFVIMMVAIFNTAYFLITHAKRGFQYAIDGR